VRAGLPHDWYSGEMALRSSVPKEAAYRRKQRTEESSIPKTDWIQKQT
jgi:hypothetical protein